MGCLGNFVLQIVVLFNLQLFPFLKLYCCLELLCQLFPFLKLYCCLELLCNMRERARDACIRQWLINTPVTEALFGGLGELGLCCVNCESWCLL